MCRSLKNRNKLFCFSFISVVQRASEWVDGTRSILERKDVDEATSSNVIGWNVGTMAADIAVALRRLCDVTFPHPWTADVIGNVGFQLEPPSIGSSAVHVNVK